MMGRQRRDQGRLFYESGWKIASPRTICCDGSMFLLAKTPGATVAKLQSQTLKALQTSKVCEMLASLGIDPTAMYVGKRRHLVRPRDCWGESSRNCDGDEHNG